MKTWQEPLHTYDCCWLLGVDVLSAKKVYVAKDVFIYRDCMARKDVTVPVDIYSVVIGGETIFVAIGSYRGGKLVWVEEDDADGV